MTAEMNKKERGIVNRRLEAFVAALCAETEALRSFLEDFRDMEEDKLDSFPDALLDSPAGLLIEEHIGVRDHRFQPKNDHRFQPVQMSSNSTNIQNAVDSIFVSLSYLRQYGSVAEVHLSDYLVLSSVRLACKVEAIGSVEKTVQYALRKN